MTTPSQTTNRPASPRFEPWAIGVCSWSLQVSSVAELTGLIDQLGVRVVSLACGDPHHASWVEGDDLPRAACQALEAGRLVLASAMCGFPGEDYTSPATIQATGGFGPPELRAERLAILDWALQRAVALGVPSLTLHGGFIPPPGAPQRKGFLETLTEAANRAANRGIILALETGQETAALLRTTLDELSHPAVKINFDPANMILYDMGDPVAATELLAADIISVHCKDAQRPQQPGQWGCEVVLGTGEVDVPRWLKTLKAAGYTGPLIVERELGDQASRCRDIATAIGFLKAAVAQL